MLRSASDFNIPRENWDRAKQEAQTAMIDRAKLRGRIAYSELTPLISAVRFDPYDTRLSHLLGEVSVEEDAAGRGMLSAVVVHKNEDMQPGEGFFVLAKHLGRNTKDVLRFWITELNKVHDYWANKHR